MLYNFKRVIKYILCLMVNIFSRDIFFCICRFFIQNWRSYRVTITVEFQKFFFFLNSSVKGLGKIYRSDLPTKLNEWTGLKEVQDRTHIIQCTHLGNIFKWSCFLACHVQKETDISFRQLCRVFIELSL